MSLFADLYVGTSGLQGSQEALNVTAHNITNTDTTGYVRQQVSYGTREYNRISMSQTGVAMKQTGLGVYISEVRQVRDQFVDASFRREEGRRGFYDASYAAIEEIEEVFGELDGANFYESMNNMWTAIEELVKDPSSEVCQSMFVQYAQSFCEAAGNVYKDLSDYQDKLNVTVKNDVDRINEIGHKIYELNNSIRTIEAGKVEHANDLKDQRNQLLDELAKLANITYDTDYYGNVLVKLEQHDFVQMNRVNEMAYTVDESGFYSVFWPDSAKFTRAENGDKIYDATTAPVYNFDTPISSAIDTDLGELKSVLLARGDHRANWTDLLNEDDYDDIKESVMMNVMSEFDALVHNVVTAVNDVLASNSEVSSKYLVDEDGNPLQLFHRIGCADTSVPEFISGTDISDAGVGTTKYSRSYKDGFCYVTEVATGKELGIYTKNSNGDYLAESGMWFSAANIVVNQDLLQYPTHLGFIKEDGNVDYKTVTMLEDAFNVKKYTLNPTLTNPLSLTEYYANLVGQIANSGNVYKQLKENQDLTVENIEATRQGQIGVSTDEELANMIRFQNAYNAASRFINVIDECTEHIINTMAR